MEPIARYMPAANKKSGAYIRAVEREVREMGDLGQAGCRVREGGLLEGKERDIAKQGIDEPIIGLRSKDPGDVDREALKRLKSGERRKAGSSVSAVAPYTYKKAHNTGVQG